MVAVFVSSLSGRGGPQSKKHEPICGPCVPPLWTKAPAAADPGLVTSAGPVAGLKDLGVVATAVCIESIRGVSGPCGDGTEVSAESTLERERLWATCSLVCVCVFSESTTPANNCL